MAGNLEQIAEGDIPVVDSDVRGWWRAIAPAAHLLNALLNCNIVTSSGKNALTFTENNSTLEINVPASTETATPSPLTVVDASDKTHPGRVRVYNGRLGGLLPDEMNLLDVLLPDGTDNHCYLTLQNGTNLIYGKVLVTAATGLYGEAHVYVVADEEDPDGDWCYDLISTWTFDGTTATKVSQDAQGNQSLQVVSSADGTMLQPSWTSNG